MAMNVNITNHMLCVGSIEMIGVASASLVQIGDTDTLTLYSIFDTPPEAVIIGPFAPLPAPDAEAATEPVPGTAVPEVIESAAGETILPL